MAALAGSLKRAGDATTLKQAARLYRDLGAEQAGLGEVHPEADRAMDHLEQTWGKDALEGHPDFEQAPNL